MKKGIKIAPVRPTLVCAWCNHVIRHGTSKVSHGICPGCAVRWFGKFRPAAARVHRALHA